MSEPRTKLKKRTTRVVTRLQVRIEAGAQAGEAFAPEPGQVASVGTSADNDLVVSDPAVSRYHLELRATDAGVVVRDLGSRNGTWAGDVRLDAATVPPGTRLRIGDTTLAVESADAVVAAGDDGAVAAPIDGLVGVSPAMQQVTALVRRLAQVTTSVLIEGETGVGKEVVARALHDTGPRREHPFVVVDCGSMPSTLIASQLFGHQRGAFTGADADSIGAFERASGGTVLLDEIGELPTDVQPALLGVLERRRFVRVGGAREIDVDVRVLAATNRDLRAEVNSGAFRSDLYYRLAVARIQVPPLRERPEDIEPLVRHFAGLLAGGPVPGALARNMADLRRQHWTGNARELRNVVEAALVMGELELAGGAPGAATEVTSATGAVEPYREARRRAIAEFERTYLQHLIDACGGNASEAARRARMDRPYLLTLLRKHRLR